MRCSFVNSWLLQALLNAVDSIETLGLLQTMAPMSYDSSRLVDVACIAFAHVDADHIGSLRAVHSAAVHAEFAVSPCRLSEGAKSLG